MNKKHDAPNLNFLEPHPEEEYEIIKYLNKNLSLELAKDEMYQEKSKITAKDHDTKYITLLKKV